MQLIDVSSDRSERPESGVDGLQLCFSPVDEILVVMTSHPDASSLQQRRALVERREQVANTNQFLTCRASSSSSGGGGTPS